MPVLGYESMASQDMCLMGYGAGAEYLGPAGWDKAPEHAYPGYLCRGNLEPYASHANTSVKYTEGLFTYAVISPNEFLYYLDAIWIHG